MNILRNTCRWQWHFPHTSDRRLPLWTCDLCSDTKLWRNDLHILALHLSVPLIGAHDSYRTEQHDDHCVSDGISRIDCVVSHRTALSIILDYRWEMPVYICLMKIPFWSAHPQPQHIVCTIRFRMRIMVHGLLLFMPI